MVRPPVAGHNRGRKWKFVEDKLTGLKRVLWCGQPLLHVWWILIHDVREREPEEAKVAMVNEW